MSVDVLTPTPWESATADGQSVHVDIMMALVESPDVDTSVFTRSCPVSVYDVVITRAVSTDGGESERGEVDGQSEAEEEEEETAHHHPATPNASNRGESGSARHVEKGG